MQNQMWPAFAKVRDWRLTIGALTRGAVSAGGHGSFERWPGGRWTGRVNVAPMRAELALEFRAFLHSLRGPAGSFLWAPPGATNATLRGTLNASTLADAETLVVASGMPRQDVRPGYYALVGTTSAGQFVQITSVTGTTTLTCTVRPRLRAAYSGGTAITVGRPLGVWRLAGETPAVPMVLGRSLEFGIEFEEFY